MSITRLSQILLLAAFFSSCSKEEPLGGGSESSSDQISFSTSADWTKGNNIATIADIDALKIYSYYLDGATWDNATSSDLKPYFTSDITTAFELTADGDSWSYEGGARFWPTDSDVSLSFLTYYPEDGFTHTLDATTGKPLLSYQLSQQAGENHDLLYAAHFNKTATSFSDGQVTFVLEHLLAKLSLKARLVGECSDDEGYENVSYTINGITITNLEGYAGLTINSDGTTEWVIDNTHSTIDMTATQGVTFHAITDSRAELSGSEDTGEYVDVMAKADEEDDSSRDQAIFMLPQGLGSSREEAPTVVVRIRKSFDSEDAEGNPFTSEIVYETEEIEIPAADSSDPKWEGGVHYGLLFDFDIANLDQYATPLTLSSEIYEWTEATVDVDVNPNIYIYASTNYIEIEDASTTTADMCFYTNYEYDLRRHKRKVELDGESYTEASGFTFYDNNDNGPYDPILIYDSKEYYYDYKYNDTTKEYDLYLVNEGGEEIKIDQVDGIADLSAYETIDEDGLGWMEFKIKPYQTEGLTDDLLEALEIYDFTYKVARTTRGDLSLYTNTAISGYASYGINKDDDDSVYILRLDIDDDHLDNTLNDGYGYFYGKIGAEMISNGGGLITNKFSITLKKLLSTQE